MQDNDPLATSTNAKFRALYSVWRVIWLVIVVVASKGTDRTQCAGVVSNLGTFMEWTNSFFLIWALGNIALAIYLRRREEYTMPHPVRYVWNGFYVISVVTWIWAVFGIMNRKQCQGQPLIVLLWVMFLTPIVVCCGACITGIALAILGRQSGQRTATPQYREMMERREV